MKKTILYACAALAAALAAQPGHAQERYGQRPPLVVSPDLTAPWVLQLGQAPGRQVRQQRRPAAQAYMPGRDRVLVDRQALRVMGVRPAREAAPQVEPDRQIRTAAITRPAQPQLNPVYLPQVVDYGGPQKPGTIVIDTTQNFLFLVEDGGKARRYGVGTGKPGFEWAGTHKITMKREWPDWRPPAEMIARERKKGRNLPVHMAGGPENPLGARALYLGSTLYRIHGTNQPWTIGQAVSSGCIRMRNEDVIDLYERVGVGTKVVVI
jgi:lipoprotein-anchoring transpeptidase ErfK/SrfK